MPLIGFFADSGLSTNAPLIAIEGCDLCAEILASVDGTPLTIFEELIFTNRQTSDPYSLPIFDTPAATGFNFYQYMTTSWGGAVDYNITPSVNSEGHYVVTFEQTNPMSLYFFGWNICSRSVAFDIVQPRPDLIYTITFFDNPSDGDSISYDALGRKSRLIVEHIIDDVIVHQQKLYPIIRLVEDTPGVFIKQPIFKSNVNFVGDYLETRPPIPTNQAWYVEGLIRDYRIQVYGIESNEPNRPGIKYPFPPFFAPITRQVMGSKCIDGQQDLSPYWAGTPNRMFFYQGRETDNLTMTLCQGEPQLLHCHLTSPSSPTTIYEAYANGNLFSSIAVTEQTEGVYAFNLSFIPPAAFTSNLILIEVREQGGGAVTETIIFEVKRNCCREDYEYIYFLNCFGVYQGLRLGCQLNTTVDIEKEIFESCYSCGDLTSGGGIFNCLDCSDEQIVIDTYITSRDSYILSAANYQNTEENQKIFTEFYNSNTHYWVTSDDELFAITSDVEEFTFLCSQRAIRLPYAFTRVKEREVSVNPFSRSLLSDEANIPPTVTTVRLGEDLATFTELPIAPIDLGSNYPQETNYYFDIEHLDNNGVPVPTTSVLPDNYYDVVIRDATNNLILHHIRVANGADLLNLVPSVNPPSTFTGNEFTNITGNFNGNFAPYLQAGSRIGHGERIILDKLAWATANGRFADTEADLMSSTPISLSFQITPVIGSQLGNSDTINMPVRWMQVFTYWEGSGGFEQSIGFPQQIDPNSLIFRTGNFDRTVPINNPALPNLHTNANLTLVNLQIDGTLHNVNSSTSYNGLGGGPILFNLGAVPLGLGLTGGFLQFVVSDSSTTGEPSNIDPTFNELQVWTMPIDYELEFAYYEISSENPDRDVSGIEPAHRFPGNTTGLQFLIDFNGRRRFH